MMMNKMWSVAVLGLALAACADDGGVAGNGGDSLPKRGELATDPTIVSATARCTTGEGVGSGPTVEVHVAASDPAGKENLGTCAGTTGAVSDQDTFGESGCYVYLPQACAAGEVKVVGLTVSNDKGGVTTASVKLTLAPAN